MSNLDNVLKSRDITLPTMVHTVKAMVFPVVMYGCDSWTIKKAERWRIDAFKRWCWGRLLRVPWTARRSTLNIHYNSPEKSHGQRSLVGCSPWGLGRVGHDWAISLSLFIFMQWRRKWQPTPVFLPGKSQGWRSLVGCRLWGCTESDTTEAT